MHDPKFQSDELQAFEDELKSLVPRQAAFSLDTEHPVPAGSVQPAEALDQAILHRRRRWMATLVATWTMGAAVGAITTLVFTRYLNTNQSPALARQIDTQPPLRTPAPNTRTDADDEVGNRNAEVAKPSQTIERNATNRLDSARQTDTLAKPLGGTAAPKQPTAIARVEWSVARFFWQRNTASMPRNRILTPLSRSLEPFEPVAYPVHLVSSPSDTPAAAVAVSGHSATSFESSQSVESMGWRAADDPQLPPKLPNQRALLQELLEAEGDFF